MRTSIPTPAPPPARGFLVALLWIMASMTSCKGAACSICPSGDPITLPDRLLNLQYPFSIDTCGKLDSFMWAITDTSDDCTGVRTLGGLCGCPVLEGTCRLCPNTSPQQPTALLTNENTEVVQRAPEGLSTTCEFVDSYLQSHFMQGDDLCDSKRNIYLPECPCIPLPVDTNIHDDTEEDDTTSGSSSSFVLNMTWTTPMNETLTNSTTTNMTSFINGTVDDSALQVARIAVTARHYIRRTDGP